jgi:hypothetical protein
LNQLPPPFVLFTLGALIAGLRRHDAGLPATRWWWLLGVCLVLQAAWGWYGFAYAIVGVAVIKTAWMFHRTRRGSLGGRVVWDLVKQAMLPSVLAMVGVLILAQPQLQLADRYENFQRDDLEVRQGSADIQHLFNRGAYRSGPADWVGQGASGKERFAERARQVVHPGWLALGLAGVGWWRRGYMPYQQRRIGRALLLLGSVGLVLAFGESVGVPGTGIRIPLPMDFLRELVPPFKAFRGAWRFSWLMVIALSWWSALAVQQIVDRQGHRQVKVWVPSVLLMVLTLLSLPVKLPALDLGTEGRLASVPNRDRMAVLTLPAPATEYEEDFFEARWLLRAMVTGSRVTGGASGWVPPEIVDLRQRLAACEQDPDAAVGLLTEWKEKGYVQVELVLRNDDQERVDFWRKVLVKTGARLSNTWPHEDYEFYELE